MHCRPSESECPKPSVSNSDRVIPGAHTDQGPHAAPTRLRSYLQPVHAPLPFADAVLAELEAEAQEEDAKEGSLQKLSAAFHNSLTHIMSRYGLA